MHDQVQRLTVLVAAVLLLVAAFGQTSGTAQDTASTSVVRSESEKAGGTTSVEATGTEPIYQAFLAAGADPQLAYAAAERVESVAGANVTTAISAQISSLEARLEARFSNLESKFDARFSNLESKFDARFSNVEARLDSQQSELATVRWAVMIQTAILVLLVGFGFSLQGRVGRLEGNSMAVAKQVAEVHAFAMQGFPSAGSRANSAAADPGKAGSAVATSAESS